MKFRPCIDLHDGKVKQIIGATLDDQNPEAVQTNFEASHDAAWYAELYKRDRLTGGHVIMLGKGNETAARQALGAYPGGLQVGGGINAANAAQWLQAGAAQVIVTSWIFVDGRLDYQRLERLVELIGTEQLVLDLSCRLGSDNRYYIVTERWQRFTQLEVTPETLLDLSSYCSEFLVHGVDVEGKQSGIERRLITLLASGPEIPIVYAGGIRNIRDIEIIAEAGGGQIDFTVGSALDIFGGKLPYRQVVKYCK